MSEFLAAKRLVRIREAETSRAQDVPLLRGIVVWIAVHISEISMNFYGYSIQEISQRHSAFFVVAFLAGVQWNANCVAPTCL